MRFLARADRSFLKQNSVLVVELFWEGKKFGELPLNKGKKKQERDIGISKYKRKKLRLTNLQKTN